jgi:hypothetical protein
MIGTAFKNFYPSEGLNFGMLKAQRVIPELGGEFYAGTMQMRSSSPSEKKVAGINTREHQNPR